MMKLNKAVMLGVAAVALAVGGFTHGQDYQAAAPADTKNMQQMQDQMRQMQQQVERLRATTDPAEREKIMKEHLRTMQEHMKDMLTMTGGKDMGDMMEHCMMMGEGGADKKEQHH